MEGEEDIQILGLDEPLEFKLVLLIHISWHFQSFGESDTSSGEKKGPSQNAVAAMLQMRLENFAQVSIVFISYLTLWRNVRLFWNSQSTALICVSQILEITSNQKKRRVFRIVR